MWGDFVEVEEERVAFSLPVFSLGRWSSSRLVLCEGDGVDESQEG